ncbi:MAG: phage antirepressor KilAC domain-containing protein [Tannerella sp.]|jgi:hypothetical protein|nr:phage antirepressor KilAC domain-containing protein [Tannerella sp.]
MSSVELSKAMLITPVMEIRRQHPRMGGKKMYYLLRDLAKELHTGRDKFFEILKESDLLVKKKVSVFANAQAPRHPAGSQGDVLPVTNH